MILLDSVLGRWQHQGFLQVVFALGLLIHPVLSHFGPGFTVGLSVRDKLKVLIQGNQWLYLISWVRWGGDPLWGHQHLAFYMPI